MGKDIILREQIEELVKKLWELRSDLAGGYSGLLEAMKHRKNTKEFWKGVEELINLHSDQSKVEHIIQELINESRDEMIRIISEEKKLDETDKFIEHEFRNLRNAFRKEDYTSVCRVLGNLNQEFFNTLKPKSKSQAVEKMARRLEALMKQIEKKE